MVNGETDLQRLRRERDKLRNLTQARKVKQLNRIMRDLTKSRMEQDLFE